ncbi:PorV/PorQ family protein [bacterium]|nr:PorV/PorQ family protein [bacterium]
MIKTRKKIIILSVLMYAFSLRAIVCFADDSRGTISGFSLRQAVGARSFGMGEAYVAISDDLDALFSNPAGLAVVQKKGLTAMYFKGLADIQTGFIGYVLPLKKEKESSLAIGLLSLHGGIIKINSSDGSSHSFNAQQDYIGMLSYARDLYGGFLVGGNVKLLRSTLVEEYTAQAVCVDLGVMYRFMEKNLNIGFSLQNLGTGIKYIQEKDSLPLTFKGGIAYKLNFEKEDYTLSFFDEAPARSNTFPGWIFSLEVEKPKETEFKGKMGFEYGKYWKGNRYLLRGGYKLGYTPDTYTCGIGCEFKEFQFDYAIGLMNDSDFLHKVSFTLRFFT